MHNKPIKSIGLFLLAGLAGCSGGSGDEQNADANADNNSAPSISGLADVGARAGLPYTYTPKASDADNDPLTFTIAGLPEWAEFDDTTGELSGIPSNSDLGTFEDIVIGVTDGRITRELAPFAIEVLPSQISADQIVTDGSVIAAPPINTAADHATQADGDTTVTVGDLSYEFNDASLVMEYDASGVLMGMSGLTNMPPQLAEHFRIDSPVRAAVGLMKGRDINTDPEFGITLLDDVDYFVFYLGAETSLTIGNAEEAEQVPIQPAIGGSITFITDPADPMVYYHGSIPFVGEIGIGESSHGQIPFVPEEDFDRLDSFKGNKLVNGAFSMGFKAVDLISFNGIRVDKQPTLFDIDWEDPFAETNEARIGINAETEFALSVFEVGLFDFYLASASGTMDLGLDRQQLALHSRLAPDVSWQPDWFPILPDSELLFEMAVTPQAFETRIAGQYHSTIPEADLEGEFILNQDEARFEAMIPDEDMPLAISARFANELTEVAINADVDVSSLIDESIDESLDRGIEEARQAIEDLESAIASHEFELSLRGMRDAIPGIAANAKQLLNALPGTLRRDVDADVVSFLNSNSACRTFSKDTIFGKISRTECARDHVNVSSVGDSAGNTARSRAAAAIVPYIQAMDDLVFHAERADDESLRAALRNALQAAVDRQVMRLDIEIKRDITLDVPIIGNKTVTFTVYDETHTQRIIPVSDANQLQVAADNVHRIQETSDLIVSTQQIIDRIPTEQALQDVKNEISENRPTIPEFGGAGYSVIGNNYTAFIRLDGEQIDVNLNVMDPDQILENVAAIVLEEYLTP